MLLFLALYMATFKKKTGKEEPYMKPTLFPWLKREGGKTKMEVKKKNDTQYLLTLDKGRVIWSSLSECKKRNFKCDNQMAYGHRYDDYEIRLNMFKKEK